MDPVYCFYGISECVNEQVFEFCAFSWALLPLFVCVAQLWCVNICFILIHLIMNTKKLKMKNLEHHMLKYSDKFLKKPILTILFPELSFVFQHGNQSHC